MEENLLQASSYDMLLCVVSKHFLFTLSSVVHTANIETYRKIPKISPGAYIFQRPLGLIFGGAYIRRGLSTERNWRFKIDWASLIVGSKITVFALFYFVFEVNFPSTSPRGAYIWRGALTEGFLRYRFGGLIFGGAYTWRGLFSEFYGISSSRLQEVKNHR